MDSLSEILALSGSISSSPVGNHPVRIYYLASILDTAERIKDTARALKELEKLHQAAIAHGYRGHSSGHKNGVVDIRPTDKHLLRDYAKLLEQNRAYFSEKNLDAKTLRPVKLVAHVPSGNRLIGAIDLSKTDSPSEVYILGFSNYSGRVS